MIRLDKHREKIEILNRAPDRARQLDRALFMVHPGFMLEFIVDLPAREDAVIKEYKLKHLDLQVGAAIVKLINFLPVIDVFVVSCALLALRNAFPVPKAALCLWKPFFSHLSTFD